MKKKTATRIKELIKDIQYHDSLYYNLDKPQITDFQYDQLFAELKKLEEQYPELKKIHSPTQKIPGEALSQFQKKAHTKPMLSLQNTYSIEDIKSFYERTLKLLKSSKLTCFLEPKLDGMAVELIYKKGILTHALSRGDGQVGEDITTAIKTLRGLPLYLGNKTTPILEVRAEVLIFKKDFEQINKDQELAGQALYANPRNLAAGSLRQLDPKITAQRPLHCFVHSLGGIEIPHIKNQEEFLKHLKKLGLPCFDLVSSKKLKPNLELCQLSQSLEDTISYYTKMQELRPHLPFEIDGIVIKVNDFDLQEKLGNIARSSRWAVAGKFPPEQGVTILKEIKLQVGRTGIITPVAVLKPVLLGGVKIQTASLYNFKEIERKDIRPGDSVLLHRAGDVIPEVIKVQKRKQVLAPFKAPSNCPVCQSKVQEQGDYLLCKNSACPAVIESKLFHFASKKALNIEFLGEKSIKKFCQWGWLKNYSDIYDLKNKSLKEKEGFGEKSYQLLLDSLQKSKNTSLARLLFALGIPLVGEQTAQKISERTYLLSQKESLDILSALEILQKISQEELENIDDVGPLVAQSFKRAFENQEFIEDIKGLQQRGLVFPERKQKTSLLTGLIFVITGTLPINRTELKDQIENQGGKLSSQVSSKTDFLIAGETPGSKAQKALDLSIPILTYEDFLKQFKLRV